MTVLSSRDNDISRITLNRPQRRNALSIELLGALAVALDDAAADSTTRIVVITGAGETFCSGADLADAASVDDYASAAPRAIADVLTRMVDHPKPIIGRVNGSAFGGGLGLIAACDLAVAVEDARFAFSEVRYGLAPAAIAPFVLRKVPATIATPLMLLADPVPAAELVTAGLLTREVTPSALDAVVDGWCDQLRRGGPQALAVTKRLLSRVPMLPRDAAIDWATTVSAATFASEEAVEGLSARADKRLPRWRGGVAT